MTAHVSEHEGERRAQEAYNVLLAHIDGCRVCQAMKTCDEGARIRRALRASRSVDRTARTTHGDTAGGAS